MISVIICSVNKFLLNSLEKNISETIGVPFEIIAIDNSVNHHGICKVYNEGGRKARFPYLCFAHEDILFETKDWGLIVSRYLDDQYIGLIGIAGGDTKGRVPSSWSIPIISNEINLVQHDKTKNTPPREIHETNSSISGKLKKVVALDGVWLCTKKEIFDQFRFDDKLLPGFHGYDIDYSLQVNTKYNLCVVSEILIHHYSAGNPDRKWINSAILISKKWKKHLPVSVCHPSPQQYSLHHWHSLRIFLQHLFRLKYNRLTIIKFYLLYSFTRFFSLRRFLSMGKFVVTSMWAEKKPG